MNDFSGSNTYSGQPSIVLSRAARPDEVTVRYEQALLDMLQLYTHRPILIIPHLYHLRPDHPAVARLRQIDAPIVLLSWLYPRAARWTLAALMGQTPTHLAALNLSRFAEPASCAALAETLLMTEGEAPLDLQDMVEHCMGDDCMQIFDGSVPVVELESRWYPVIDRDRCVNCRQCVDFCLFGVYSADGDGSVQVENPDSCKNGCPACSRICPQSAIIFPHYESDANIAGAMPQQAAPTAGDPASAGNGYGQAPAGANGGAMHGAAGNGGPMAAPADDLDSLMDQLDELDRGH